MLYLGGQSPRSISRTNRNAKALRYPKPDSGPESQSLTAKKRAGILCAVALASCAMAFAEALSSNPVHVIEVLADKDSLYKIAGEKKPEIHGEGRRTDSVTDHGAQGEIVEPGWINTRILAASSQGSVQSAGLGSVTEAGYAGVFHDRTGRTWRIRRGVYRNLQ